MTKVGVKRGKAGHLGLFLRVTFPFLHHEQANAFFTHFLIEARSAKNKHPPLTDKRQKRLDSRVGQRDTQNIITKMVLA